MTTKQICFRYDGSEEAKQCIEWINSNKPHRSYLGLSDHYYDRDGFFWKPNEPMPEMRLVTPAEFLRLVSGELEWKVGDECFFESDKCRILAIHNNLAWVVDEKNHYGTVELKHIRPVRKSVREEINEIVKDWLLSENQYDLADRILDIIKQRKEEL